MDKARAIGLAKTLLEELEAPDTHDESRGVTGSRPDGGVFTNAPGVDPGGKTNALPHGQPGPDPRSNL